nr:somatic embryogenesis receptor kinase 4 [Quercus suber]
MDLSNNKLYGRLPPQLGEAFQLQVLDLSSNKIHGKIPKELGQVVAVKKLHPFSEDTRIISSDTSYWTSFAGTFGYAAPEHAYTMERACWSRKSNLSFTSALHILSCRH